MSVYSVKLFNGAVPTSAAAVYTAPPGVTIVIRHIALWIPNALGTLIYVGPNESGSTTPLIALATAPANTVALWEGRVVLAAGDNIEAAAPSSGNSLWISGYSLE